MLKLIIRVIVGLVLLAIVYLLVAPVPITPAAWTPPVAPTLTGQYEQNNRLAHTDRLSLGDGRSPEDVAIDSGGRIYGGFDDGRIIQLQPDGTQPHVFANTQGRPLGLAFDPAGNLIVADAIKGLLAIDKSGTIKVLATEVDGAKFGCLNDLDVSALPHQIQQYLAQHPGHPAQQDCKPGHHIAVRPEAGTPNLPRRNPGENGRFGSEEIQGVDLDPLVL